MCGHGRTDRSCSRSWVMCDVQQSGPREHRRNGPNVTCRPRGFELKRLFVLAAAAASVVLVGCATTAVVSDADITNGLGRSEASFDMNVVSGVAASDAVAFYKADIDSLYKQTPATATLVRLTHLETLVTVAAQKVSRLTVEMLVSDAGSNTRVAGLTLIHENASQPLSKQLDYYITFHNSGNVPVKNILFVDDLPAELTPLSVESLSRVNDWGGPYDRAGAYVSLAPRKVAWDIKQVGERQVILIRIIDPDGLPANRSYDVRLRTRFDWPAQTAQRPPVSQSILAAH